ncbi:MAG: DUF3179 domain-containing protein, partial [Bacteroidetes bacterium]|nr:DUF3179 domain-containing protein [Bacteroidota bacterium]
VDFLADNEPVLALDIDGDARAYPVQILTWHEIVNDTVAGIPVAVTYCPLCGSGLAFDALVEGSPLTFGVSGLLYNSDVLLYDRHNESLWSQLMMQAVSGPMAGTELKMLPTQNTSWGQWKKEHPFTLLLKENTGFHRDYGQNPYPDYAKSPEVFFPLSNQDSRFHSKETIIGIEVNAKYKAYPFSELEKLKDKELRDTLNGQELLIRYDSKNKSARIFSTAGEELPAVTTFWFAWYAFYPETAVYKGVR